MRSVLGNTSKWLAGILVLGAMGFCRPSMAQYSSDYQTNIISGVDSNWTANYLVGQTNSADALLIQNGGVLSETGNGYLGYGPSASNNIALVTGTGSVWSNGLDLYVGYLGTGNQLIITNGGVVYDRNANVGYNEPAAGGNTVLVSGGGATWQNQGTLEVGNGNRGNLLGIGIGGTVFANDVEIGVMEFHSGLTNQIAIKGGALFVTNATGSATLGSNFGNLLLNGGTVTVDVLNARGMVTFNAGVLNTKSTFVDNSSPFVVGDGTNNAILNLVTGGGGAHTFFNGLTISSNATLEGIGAINNAATINAGGTLAPGTVMFSNTLTLAAGSIFAVTLNGSGAGQYSQIIGLGTMSISNCVLNVSLGYTPMSGDTFTIISNLSSTAILGNFMDTDGFALTNGADFVVNGTTFQIDYSANSDGIDVALTALIPEPSSLLLTALGAVTLVTFLRRNRV
jgi:fibronectin-binding autotransporter adhesin